MAERIFTPQTQIAFGFNTVLSSWGVNTEALSGQTAGTRPKGLYSNWPASVRSGRLTNNAPAKE